MASANLSTAQKSRLESLRTKHAVLSDRISEAQRSPGMPDDAIQLLKKQKLMLKEQIEGIRA
jgi:hypothetical protein